MICGRRNVTLPIGNSILYPRLWFFFISAIKSTLSDTSCNISSKQYVCQHLLPTTVDVLAPRRTLRKGKSISGQRLINRVIQFGVRTLIEKYFTLLVELFPHISTL